METKQSAVTGQLEIGKARRGKSLKLGDTHPHTQESIKNLIELYEAWNKPEETEKWRAELPQTEAVEE
ncbi:MAG: hypothetical protein JRD00_08020 [Deltaproteobacteria bacterium]|nr:hypothetical protein [Deltaproteobacteria bacterium]